MRSWISFCFVFKDYRRVLIFIFVKSEGVVVRINEILIKRVTGLKYLSSRGRVVCLSAGKYYKFSNDNGVCRRFFF